MNTKEITIGNTRIGGGNPVFIVAEIGINHDGKYEQALRLIDVAAETGCNAVKFQLFTFERMYAKRPGFYQIATGEKKDIEPIIKEAELPEHWLSKLKVHANTKGLEFFVTACDEVGADTLEREGADAYKIASYEITHLPLLRHVAKKQKPIIFSCGGATLKEVDEAMSVFVKEGNDAVALMHCVGQYPAALNELNLAVIGTLQKAFPRAVIGYSDHSSDPVTAPRAAVLLGAKIIEKHITLDRALPGADHSFALNPDELSLMVRTIRNTEKEIAIGKSFAVDTSLLGTSARVTYPGESEVRNFCYRSIFATKAIKKGSVFSPENIAVLRPGECARGLEPKYYELLIQGYRASRDIPDNKHIEWDDILISSHES